MNVIISNKNGLLLENLGVDVIKKMEGEFDVEEIISTFQNFYYQWMIIDITAIKNYTDITNLQKLSIALDMEKVILLLDGTVQTTNPVFLSSLVSIGIYNFAKNLEGIQYLYNSPNTYRDVAQFHRIDANGNNQFVKQNELFNTIIIGVKNVTKQSGATSLVYMMKNELSKNYNVLAAEVDKNDFVFLKDKSLVSTTTNELSSLISQNKHKDVILIDINNSMVAEGFCTEVLYLIEPSVIKLQKLMTMNAVALEGLKAKKIILNQSLLNKKDVANFEYEAKVRVFYNLPPLNERDRKLPELNKMLVKLGLNRQKSEM